MVKNLEQGDWVFGASDTEKYIIRDLINEGGFGRVYKIEDQLGSLFAIKVLRDRSFEKIVKSLFNEANQLKEIKHENVIKLMFFHDGETYPDLPLYIIMEYAEGGTLEDKIRERKTLGSQFSNDELKNIFLQLASGMKAISEKSVHRDIKPSNILISGDSFKITDFGISKILGAITRREVSTFKGYRTIEYAAPEVWTGGKNEPLMDMYSMGIVFYEIATLKHPYGEICRGNNSEEWKKCHCENEPADYRKYNPELNLKLAQLISKMMSKRIEGRPQSWDRVIDIINESSDTDKLNSTVVRLIESSYQKQLESERLTNANRNEIKQMEESDSRVYASFRQIVREIEKLVDDFNRSSVDRRLRCNHDPDIKFRIEISGSRHAVPVVIAIQPVHEDVRLEGQKILAWGYVKAPSNKGNNLLLIAGDEDDLYGGWERWSVERNAGMALKDTRPEPIPLEFSELPVRIQHLNDMDLYKISRHPFEEEKIGCYLEEWLTEII